VELKVAAAKSAKSFAWLIGAPLAAILLAFVMLWPLTRNLDRLFGGLAIFAIIVFAGSIGICLGAVLGIGTWQRK
jgi:hypothetical protein